MYNCIIKLSFTNTRDKLLLLFFKKGLIFMNHIGSQRHYTGQLRSPYQASVIKKLTGPQPH